MNILYKLVFAVLVALQVALWPSVITILFAVIYGFKLLLRYVFAGSTAQVWNELCTGGIFLLQGRERKTYWMLVISTLYFAAYFVLFIRHETTIQPSQTTWIHPSLLHNYSFVDEHNKPFDVEVASETAKDMRANPYVWEKNYDTTGILLAGAIIGVFKNTATGSLSELNCGVAGEHYDCYSRVIPLKPPSNKYGATAYLQLPSKFYTTDVRITPPATGACKNLEVLRVNLDGKKDVIHALDYPASTSHLPSNSAVGGEHCGFFSATTNCLSVKHTFTSDEYKARVGEKCAAEDNVLQLRLPERGVDIDPVTGETGLDILIVTKGSTVEFHHEWKDTADTEGTITMFGIWKQIVTTDNLQSWRTSTDAFNVLFRFFIAASPLLYSWYYLTVQFADHVSDSDILQLCLVLLLPAILIFLSFGAWLPVAGALICIVAVNYQTNLFTREPNKAHELIRQGLFFIMAACNSIQFAWIVVLIAQAGYASFFYEDSLTKLYETSFRFIVSNGASPTWIAIILPTVLLITCSFLLGTAICIVLETMALRYNIASRRGANYAA